MNADQLLKQRLEQRTLRCEVEPGKVLLMRRPLEGQFGRLKGGVTRELLAEFAFDWKGVTEADLLGAAIGAEDEAPFSQELLTDVLHERTEWANKAAKELIDSITAYLAQREATAKN
ncbi:MAG: hypothetical protein K2Q07_01360 [Burkholderiaceae bacterium]|nr:hypothetical protein [Burkholderiaceae bacterium]